MKKLKIYIHDTGIEEPLERALNIITDDWIDKGNSCHQTISDLRNTCKELLDWKKRVEVAADEVISGFDSSMGQYVSNRSIARLAKELRG